MKKITILSVVLFLCAGVFAQNSVLSLGKNNRQIIPKAAKPMLNTAKAIIWQNDFSVASTWTIAAGVGTDNWVIGTTAPGCPPYNIPAIASTTAINGYGLFDSNCLCSGNQIGNLTTASSFSCVGHTSVALTFEQSYRRFYDSTFVYVSNNGTTWTKFVVNQALIPNASTANPTLTSVNISSVAANQATVWIRFTFYSPTSLGTNAGCGYAWMVDDVKVIDLNANDLTATKSFFDLDGSGYYEIIPFSQMGVISYGEDVMNNGSSPQTNVTVNVDINNGAITASSAALASLAPTAHDTLWAQPTITSPGVATYYDAKISVSQTETDINPADNIGDSISFLANQTYFARSDNPTVYLTSYSFGTGAPAVTGMEYGSNYQFKYDAQIDSIAVPVYMATANTSITGKLYTVTGANVHTLVAQTSPYTLTPANLPDLIRLPLLTPYNVAAGTTVLCATAAMNINVANNDTIGLLCDDMFPGDPAVAGAAYLQVSGTWGWYSIIGTVPIVDLILHDVTIGINETEESNNFSIYPNPANDAVNIVAESNIISVKVMNTIGQVVVSDMPESNACIVNTSGLIPGVYFVQLQTTEGNSYKADHYKEIII